MKNYFKRLFSNRFFLTGFIMFSLVFSIMIISFFWTPYQYDATDNASKLISSFGTDSSGHFHLFGTDNQGRDIFSRVMTASRISILIGFCVMAGGAICGFILGALSGYFGGKTDAFIMKIINVKMSFPGILMALLLIAVFGNGFGVTLIALIIMAIPRFTRIIRAGFIKNKNALFVISARAKGASHLRIIFRHILPTIISDIAVTCTLSFGLAILSESGLSYLGLGVNPLIPSFGNMLKDGQNVLFQSPNEILITALFLITLVLGLNLMGDGISKENQK